MTRTKTVAEIVEGPAECLLCGNVTPTFVDPEDEDDLAAFELCGPCSRAFQDLAAGLVARS